MCAFWEQRAQPIQEVFCGVFWELHNLSENHLDIYLCNSTEMAEIYRLLGLWDRRSLTQLENLFYWSKHKRLLSLFYIAGSNGSGFKFSSVFEPFEFLDKSFCALWTFFRCLFMFLLGPKFFLHWDIQHLRGLVCASSSAGDLWKNDDFHCMFQSYISTDQAAVCVLLSCDCWGRV